MCLEQTPTLQVTDGIVILEHIWPSRWKLQFNADPEPYLPTRSRLRGPLRPTASSPSDENYRRVYRALSDEESFQVEGAHALLTSAVDVLTTQRPRVVPIRDATDTADPLAIATQLCHDLAYWHLSKGRPGDARTYAQRKCDIMNDMSDAQLNDPYIEWTQQHHRGICGACGLTAPDLAELTQDTLTHVVLQHKRLTAEQEEQLAQTDTRAFMDITAELSLLHQYISTNADGVNAQLLTVFCLQCIETSRWSLLDVVLPSQAARVHQVVPQFPETGALSVLRDRLELHTCTLEGDRPIPPPLHVPTHVRTDAISDCIRLACSGKYAEARQSVEGGGVERWTGDVVVTLVACIEAGTHGGGEGGGDEAGAVHTCAHALTQHAVRNEDALSALFLHFWPFPWTPALATVLLSLHPHLPHGIGRAMMTTPEWSLPIHSPSSLHLQPDDATAAALMRLTHAFFAQLPYCSVAEAHVDTHASVLLAGAHVLHGAGRSADATAAAMRALFLLTSGYSHVDMSAASPAFQQMVSLLSKCLQDTQPFLSALLLQYTTPIDYTLARTLLGKAVDTNFIVTGTHSALMWDLTLQEMFTHLQRQSRSYVSNVEFPVRTLGPHTITTASPLYSRLLLATLLTIHRTVDSWQ
ncbi:hypothetical protein PTSG_12255 [Salpingoeca rosetta]|uniref:Uncharacterized protein n=1 Tax=Salpingoeca rosetta (strain ATCC 50818 / BSB-021) TaxID=946362 RepID=F2UAG8_SALR5|nr:uncharacterized protein PTSG_12255 [Salpingoeca rosetta]EGD73384.1 hypothetical protein PTSG_12255 [Salpingoeca rosetta]|eukprot:XP_004993666.1 hypothetical protein PTSG_12255 [Salpingoeca rosetta]